MFLQTQKSALTIRSQFMSSNWHGKKYLFWHFSSILFFYILSLALYGKNYFSARKTCKEVCLLSGFLLGPIGGGLSAGIGSALYDLTSPAYVTSAPFTFVFKFLMAWACGIPYRLWKNKGKTILYSAVSGTAGFTKS